MPKTPKSLTINSQIERQYARYGRAGILGRKAVLDKCQGNAKFERKVIVTKASGDEIIVDTVQLRKKREKAERLKNNPVPVKSNNSVFA